MAAFPHSYTVREILPPEDSSVGRDGYQECELHRTTPRNKKRAQWYCRYMVDVIVGPGQTRRIERRKYFGLCAEVSEREAKRQRDEFRRAVNAPLRQKLESQVPMSAWLQTYEDTYIPTLKPNSQTVYRQVCRMARSRFGDLRLCDVTTERVQGWINELAVTRSRARLAVIRVVLRSVFEVASDYGRFETRNPVDRVRLPHGKVSNVDRRALSPDELRRLLSVADHIERQGIRIGDVLRVALFCGLRIGETLALQWRDIRGRELHIERNKVQYETGVTAPKSKAGSRVVPLGPVGLVRRDDARDTDRVFPLEYAVVYRALRRVFKLAGIQISGTACHALRRAYATYVDAAGAVTLSAAMGHSSQEMTKRYVRRGFEDQERASMSMAELVIGSAESRKV
jgi:integrase